MLRLISRPATVAAERMKLLNAELSRTSCTMLPSTASDCFARPETVALPAGGGTLFDSKSVLGFHLRSLLAHREMLEDSTRVLLDWIQQGTVRPHIGRMFPLADIREAHTLLESRASTGKIVLIP